MFYLWEKKKKKKKYRSTGVELSERENVLSLFSTDANMLAFGVSMLIILLTIFYINNNKL